MILFINPGTEDRGDATLENAQAIAVRIVRDLGLPPVAISRSEQMDSKGGFFGFQVDANGVRVELAVPGDDPDLFCQGKPFGSRRMYVDGSSWLYGYALAQIKSRINKED